MVPLKMISRIQCYKIIKTTTIYFVEGIATANEAKIKERLPWVLNGWILPRSIEVDKGLTCGIKILWNTTNIKYWNFARFQIPNQVWMRIMSLVCRLASGSDAKCLRRWLLPYLAVGALTIFRAWEANSGQRLHYRF